ncbi:zinc-binding dehydrogenase [Microvirga brassicacearum]|uniref:Zinc-binding dehydrogenase n=1 Tax=Microvirga brassicacearum TaxID=2580413 RepID=A0A5N3PE83_9HYPH|nr:zinc-binding dehydrogenase [Microvirga brassicacearum]KAB0268048.1 zinc-binding dehydrogenase [Microvirga brassicacearum]
MRAFYIKEHGGPEACVYATDYPDPVARPGEVVLRVKASTLNYHDIFTRRGMPGITLRLPVVPGLDVAGEVVEIGEGVEGWSLDDRVVVDPINRIGRGIVGETIDGGLAEYCAVPAHQLIRIPDNVDFNTAAVMPTAYATALRMMFTNGRVSEGEKVGVLGASGGVGVCCVQLAKLAGAEVVAFAGSDEKLARLKELGADHVINYQEKDFLEEIYSLYGKPSRRGPKATNGLDVIVNYTGGDTWVKSLKTLRVGGRLLTCGATAGFDPVEDIRYIWVFELQIRGSNAYTREDIVTCLDLASQGKLKALIDETYTLDRAAEAFARVEERRVLGKVLVRP